MKEIIAKGKSLGEIRNQWAEKWECPPEELDITIIQRPSLLNRNWTVNIRLRKEAEPVKTKKTKGRIIWEESKYIVTPQDSVISIVPFPMVGRLIYKGKEFFDEFEITSGDSFEFHPLVKNGGFSWELRVADDGSKAIAKVKHERSGRFVLEQEIDWRRKWFLERHVVWQDLDWSIDPEMERKFKEELTALGIVSGLKPDFWQEMINIEGTEEVVIAEQIDPIEPVQPTLEVYLNNNLEQDMLTNGRIDFFTSKLLVCKEDDIIARKIPGKEGIPGKNIFGQELPVEKVKDFQLRARKNAYVTEDGLEVRAKCSGAPLKLQNYTYAVEEVYMIDRDVDLDTGSIEFPGDVIVKKNVQDGLHIFSGSRISIDGLVSGAELKAEGGISIGSNVFNSVVTVGEKHYLRSRFVTKLKELEESLGSFLQQLYDVQKAAGEAGKSNLFYKDIFRTLLEKKHPEIPKIVRELSTLTQKEDETFFTREIIIAVHTIKYFMGELDTPEIKNNSYLAASLKEIHNFLLEQGSLIPENVAFIAGYVQNSQIVTSGDFICRGDIYNSNVRAEGSIRVFGACRVSKLISGDRITVHELGNAEGGGDSIIKLPQNGHLTAEYCHSNVKIFIGNEYVHIDRTVRKLDVYVEKGRLWVDKLKWLNDDLVSSPKEHI